jgi:hypothetical protein
VIDIAEKMKTEKETEERKTEERRTKRKQERVGENIARKK